MKAKCLKCRPILGVLILLALAIVTIATSSTAKAAPPPCLATRSSFPAS